MMIYSKRRTLEVLAFVSGFIFLASITCNMVMVSTTTTYYYVKMFNIANMVCIALLSKCTIVLALIFFIMLFLYLRQPGLYHSIKVNPIKLMNFLVCLYMLKFLTVLPLPMFSLSVALFLLCILVPRKYRIQTNMRVFWLVLWGFFILEAIEIIFALQGFGEIRKIIPVKKQVMHMSAFLSGFIVYYVVKRNNWGFQEFEKFFKILMYGIMVVALESIITFYLGIGREISIFGYTPIHLHINMFQSTLIGSYKITSRLGITLFFISIYFLLKHQQKRYIVFVCFGFLLTFATGHRQCIMALMIGLALWIILLIREKLKEVDFEKRALAYSFLVLIMIGFAFASISLLDIATSLRGTEGAGDPIGQIVMRIIRWSRGVSVFLYTFPLGTGNNMNTYFMGSSLVPWNITEWTCQLFDIDLTRIKWCFVSNKIFVETGLELGHTIHNLWFRTITEFGLLGLVFVMYLWWNGWKIFVCLCRLQGKMPLGNDFPQVWAVFMMVFSICLSVCFEDKFRSYWYFAILFAFLELCVQKVSSQVQRCRDV